jgi:nitrous oxidase accessory protein
MRGTNRTIAATLLLVALAGTAPLRAESTAGATTPAGDFDLREALERAPVGSTIRIPAGVHAGGVSIDRPLSLIGDPGAIIDGGGRGDALTITAPDVTVRGLTIRHTGKSLDRENAGVTVLAPRATLEDNVLHDVLFGIYLKQAPGSVIRNNRIGGKDLAVQRRGDAIRVWYSADVLIEDNVVSHSRDVVIWFSSGVRLLRNRIHHGRYGLHFMYSDHNVIEENDLRENSVGAFLMYSDALTLRRNTLAYNRGPSGYGIGLKDMDGVDAVDNLILGNRVGIYLDNSPGSVEIHDRYERNFLAYNDIGIAFQPSVRRNGFVDNTFLENLEQVAVLDSSELRGNEFTLGGRGNFWSDYQGYDLDGDGLGDLPHEPVSLFENLMDRQPKLRLFLYSPAQQAIELAARAFPAMRPRPKFTDSAPLMQPAAIGLAQEETSFSWTMAVAAAALLFLPMLLLAGERLGLRRRARVPVPASPRRGREAAIPRESTMRRESTMLSVKDLTKRYGRFTAVDRFSFEVRSGEALALWGDNGAGKTSVIRCILGLERFEGRIGVGSVDLARNGKRVRRLVGYVPQELAFYDDLTARETLVFYGKLKRIPTGRAGEVLADVGLEDHGDKPVAALSGGMKQRLALAIALLADPPLLILDEMTSNLDSAVRANFLSLLERLKRRGKTVLYTSHRLEEVAAIADRVLVMEAGRLRLECRPEELTERLGLRTSLKLYLEEGMTDRALEILRAGGYAPQRNGTGVWVEVQPDAKLAPIEALMAGDLRVVDFELAGDPDAAMVGPDEED